MALYLNYMGFCGQKQFAAKQSRITTRPFQLHNESMAHDFGVNWGQQYIHPQTSLAQIPQSQQSDEYVLLSGIVSTKEPFFVERIASSLRTQNYASLPPGDYCGCFVAPDATWIFKTRSSNDTIFYQYNHHGITWSTNPRDLASPRDLNDDALALCCTGSDRFVYTGIEPIGAGSVIRFDETSPRSFLFDTIAQRPPLSHTTLEEMVVAGRMALVEATRPLVESTHKIGILLSGGIDSSAVAAALCHNGAQVIAGYHFSFPNSAADETAYAQAVCKALGIPFAPIQVSQGASDYLSLDWRFPHPYGHAGYRWMEQVAERAAQDGVTLLVTGRGGDPTFGPQNTYGLYDILSAPIAAKEKLAMLLGAISTDWLLPDLLKSLSRTTSLIHEQSLSTTAHSLQKTVPFLRCLASVPAENIHDVTRFSAQDLVLETALWKPHGIRVAHPFHHAAVQNFAASLPIAYRLIPYRGMKVVKPILRLAFADMLPPLVVKHRWGSWLSSPGQNYCIQHADILQQLIGSPTAHLAQRDIIDPSQVRVILKNPQAIREHTRALLATAMVELFLRQFIAVDPRESATRIHGAERKL